MRHFIYPALLATLFVGLCANGDDFVANTAPVGRAGDNLITPVNQLITPAGIQLQLPGMRPQALALSPDAKLLVTSGLTHELVVVDPVTGQIMQHVAFPSDQAKQAKAISAEILSPDNKAQLSFTGLTFSRDGTRIYLANVNGDIKVFGVDRNHQVAPLYSLAVPPAKAPSRAEEIPAGIAVSADGKKLYVALNLSNRLLEMDAETGKVLRLWNVGVAPFDVVVTGHKAYVSNWGGRRPAADSVTGPAGQGTTVRVDARSIASEGSVTVIDLAQPVESSTAKEIVMGPHVGALALSPNSRWLVAASAGTDLLSVIDTRNDEVAETICARQNPGDLFGAQPDALAFDRSGKKLYVANATQNAVAVFQFKPGESTLLGLIPVGWFPGAIVVDGAHDRIEVANIKGLAAQMQPSRSGKGLGYNTHQYFGSLSLVPVPTKDELAKMTQIALADMRYPLLAQAKLPPRNDRKPQPVPERAGEPSVFKHVIYIIKENRTYDQVLGDVKAGNGDPGLCIFGESVTPNQHKLVHDFVLLDNTYCSGILSADGHQWADSGLANDYVEREFAGWPRSYPCGGEGESGRDALAYSPAGFIWDDALAHHQTVVNFGEFTSGIKHWKNPSRKGKITFADTYRDYLTGANEIEYTQVPDIEALRPYQAPGYVGWDLNVPDVSREAVFAAALKQYEKTDTLPNLVVVYVPNDHTSGTKAGAPTPAAQVADNDLAVGRILEALSHSKFWKDTCLFGIEDDPQNGWDHVSGYRTTAYVASAYTKRNTVVSTQYNQTSLLRTMELMLGLPPMNQLDATATPMFDCFTNTPDFTAFDTATNQVPLDQLNGTKTADAELRKDAIVSARLPLDKPDQCPEDVLNHILWRAMMGSQKPYPAWAVKVVDDD